MKSPRITDIEYAVAIYYGKIEIGNPEIKKLFNIVSNSTVGRLKKGVIARMAEKGERCFGATSVNTKTAFEVWGLDVKDLEYRLKKLDALRAKKFEMIKSLEQEEREK